MKLNKNKMRDEQPELVSEAIAEMKEVEWWMEDYGFFGDFYIEGDNSKCGYLQSGEYTLNERTKMEVDGIVNLTDLMPHHKVLDVPCGYGRHTIELSKRNYIVTGSDINSVHLEVARTYAVKNNLSAEFAQENMIDIKYKSKFDVVLNMFYSFGFFKTDEENLQVLRNFYEALTANGKFLMHTDVNLPRVLNGKYKVDECRKLQSDNELRIIDTYNTVTKRMDGAWIIKKKNGEIVEKTYSVRVYTKDEFVDMCKEVGFRRCIAYSDWNGLPYNENSEDMMIVAQK